MTGSGAPEWVFPSTLPSRATDPFVGRLAESEALDAAWRTVADGGSAVVLVGGEAGAGKTRLAAEMAARWHREGALVLCGLCDSELALPYQPWVMALDALVAQVPEHVLADASGELGHLQTLIPRVEHAMGGSVSVPRLRSEADPIRLFNAVAGLLRSAGGLAPIVLVLEDLQWAGRQTLALLRYLVRHAPVDRLLVVGTFRDTGDEVGELLATMLADLRRVEAVVRLKLGGIGVDDVREILAARGMSEELQNRAEVIAMRTDGNPFLVGELSAVDGDVVPDGVREVVVGQIDRLGVSTRRLAHLIAVGGRLDLPVLREAVGETTGDLGTAIAELLQSGMVQELEGPVPTYRFAHDLIRDAVSGSMPAFSRVEVHQAIAGALERVHADDRRLVVAELARHYSAAAPVVGVDKALYFARRAAAQARRTAAYDEGVELLEAAIAVTSTATSDRAELLLEQADLLACSGRNREGLECARRACEAAREARDDVLRARVAVEMVRIAHRRNEGGDEMVRLVEDVLDGSGALPADLRVRLLATMGRAMVLAGQPGALDQVRLALEEARQLENTETISLALEVAATTEPDPAVCLERATELERITAETGNRLQSMWAVSRRAFGLLAGGRLVEASEAVDRFQQLAEVHLLGDAFFEARGFASMLAMVGARLDDAESLLEATDSVADLIYEGIEAAGDYGLQMFMIRREQGRLDEMRPILKLLVQSEAEAALWRPGVVVAFAELGMLDEARAGFDDLVVRRFEAVPRDTVWPLALSFLSDTCVHLEDAVAAGYLLRELEPFGGSTLIAGITTAGPTDRHRAAMAELAGARDLADSCIADAAALAESSGSPVWQAHVEETWAWMVARRGDRLGAEAHFARARELADRHGLGAIATELPEPAPTTETAGTAPARPDGLSPRELEVLALLVEGRTNQGIAEVLFISRNTAANHVRSILQKTGSANRTEAAVYALERGALERGALNRGLG